MKKADLTNGRSKSFPTDFKLLKIYSKGFYKTQPLT